MEELRTSANLTSFKYNSMQTISPKACHHRLRLRSTPSAWRWASSGPSMLARCVFLVMHYLRLVKFSQLSFHLTNVSMEKGDVAFLFFSLVLERLPCLQIPAVCSSSLMSTLGLTRASSPSREDAMPSPSTSRGRKSLRSEMRFGSDQSILENVVYNP